MDAIVDTACPAAVGMATKSKATCVWARTSTSQTGVSETCFEIAASLEGPRLAAPARGGSVRTISRRLSDQADCPAQARTAVMTTFATSLGWEIMETCEAPSISVTVAPARS